MFLSLWENLVILYLFILFCYIYCFLFFEWLVYCVNKDIFYYIIICKIKNFFMDFWLCKLIRE